MQYRILLIEDTPALAQSIGDILVMENYHVTMASNGKDALKKLTPIPHLIISDLVMPEMNGEEFVSLIRSNPIYASVFIIILSTRVTDENFDVLEYPMADAFLKKPFNSDCLLHAIKSLLQNEYN
jgi:DNA-binding response OmpR family regulator